MLSIQFVKLHPLKGKRIVGCLIVRYALTPDEIAVYCDQFIKDQGNRIQIAVLGKQMHRFSETIDDNVCNGLNFCPKGWKSLEEIRERDVSDLEMEL